MSRCRRAIRSRLCRRRCPMRPSPFGRNHQSRGFVLAGRKCEWPWPHRITASDVWIPQQAGPMGQRYSGNSQGGDRAGPPTGGIGRPTHLKSATTGRSRYRQSRRIAGTVSPWPGRRPVGKPPGCPVPQAFSRSGGDREAARTTLSRARIMWRSQSRALRTSYSSRPTSCLAISKKRSSKQRRQGGLPGIDCKINTGQPTLLPQSTCHSYAACAAISPALCPARNVIMQLVCPTRNPGAGA